MRKTTRDRTANPVVVKAIHIQPKTENQDRLLRAIRDHQLVVAVGPAGVGKTYIAAQAAANLLVSGQVRRIIITRANVPTGRSLGFFPGTIKDKLEPWLAPIINVLKQRLGVNDYDARVHNGSIVLCPLETIRGSSFENSVILVDEAQNLTYEEVKAVTTRIGENSRMVLMGDPMQKDIGDSGLNQLKAIVKRFRLDVPVVTFTLDDIVRSDIVATLVRTFIEYEDLEV